MEDPFKEEGGADVAGRRWLHSDCTVLNVLAVLTVLTVPTVLTVLTVLTLFTVLTVLTVLIYQTLEFFIVLK